MRIARTLAVALGLAFVHTAYADSLYSENSFESLVSDRKAFRVGDNITVLIVENASASTTAATTANKNGNLEGRLTDTPGLNLAGGIGISEEFTGGGKVQRTGKLLAQITVRVQSIAANGDLQIKGEQLIAMNDEEQRIAVEGRVRPQDIGSNNTVLSTRVGDARISYVGDGVLGEKQRPGLLWRFMSWLGLI